MRHQEPIHDRETLADVLAWAAQTSQPYDAVCELRKVPARLGLHDADLGLVPADLGYFEERIAPSPYAVVSRARDMRAARKRGNARLRALLARFAARGRAVEPDDAQRASWDALIAWVQGRSAPPGQGQPFNVGAARSLLLLRARAGCAPAELTQERLEVLARDLPTDKRKALRRSVRLLGRLQEQSLTAPELEALLPRAALAAPRGVARAPKLDWSAMPEAFRLSVDSAIAHSVATLEDQVATADRRIAAGEDPAEVMRWFNTRTSRAVANRHAAEACRRGALAWLVRDFQAEGGDVAALADVRDVLEPGRLVGAVRRHVAHVNASPYLKDAGRSQTLHSRLVALQVLARHGLEDAALDAQVGLLLQRHARDMRRPGSEQADDMAAFCRLVQSSSSVARRLVNGPAELARIAEERLAEAGSNEAARGSALRLYAGAVLFAIQMARPLRTANLRRLRIASSGTVAANLRRVSEGYEALFPKGEVKNAVAVSFDIVGDDARIVGRWLDALRPLYAEHRGIADSVYLVPGMSTPERLKAGLTLPRGAMSPGAFNELWRDAMEHLGVRMTPHMCRHAVATLVLALEPGNYAKAAAILGDTEDTVRRYYGRDSGAAAARSMREALLAAHPGLLAQLTRRVA